MMKYNSSGLILQTSMQEMEIYSEKKVGSLVGMYLDQSATSVLWQAIIIQLIFTAKRAYVFSIGNGQHARKTKLRKTSVCNMVLQRTHQNTSMQVKCKKNGIHVKSTRSRPHSNIK